MYLLGKKIYTRSSRTLGVPSCLSFASSRDLRYASPIQKNVGKFDWKTSLARCDDGLVWYMIGVTTVDAAVLTPLLSAVRGSDNFFSLKVCREIVAKIDALRKDTRF